MFQRTLAPFVAVVLALASSSASAWGDRTHQFLTRQAVGVLPADAGAYYRPYVDTLAERCLEPDTVLRAREGRAESIRHFIDLDAHMSPPFTGFPQTFDGAVRRFGRRQVERNGVLPWVIMRFRRQLREAIRKGDVGGAMREAGYLSHYVADAFQPLHLTTNHDGQKTGGRGLHRRYEDGLVDARIEDYGAAFVDERPAATYLQKPRELVFDGMFRSYEVVGIIVDADRSVGRRARRGSRTYYAGLDDELRAPTIRQLSAATSMIGSLWLTAWQEAQKGGQEADEPD